MNKKRVDAGIPYAYNALKKYITEDKNEIDPTYRTYICSFGTSVLQGSPVAAVAFYGQKSNSVKADKLTGDSLKREKLMDCVFDVLKQLYGNDIAGDTLFDYVAKNQNNLECKRRIVDASISIKLAMNLFAKV